MNSRVAGVGGSSWIPEDMLNKPSLGVLVIGPTTRPSGWCSYRDCNHYPTKTSPRLRFSETLDMLYSRWSMDTPLAPLNVVACTTKSFLSWLSPMNSSTSFAQINQQQMPWQTWGPPSPKANLAWMVKFLTSNISPNGFLGFLFLPPWYLVISHYKSRRAGCTP